MPAPEGNQNGIKLKDPKIRQDAYKAYCEHIANGYPKHAFYFEKDEHTCCWATLDEYIKDTIEFDPFLMRAAKAKRYKKWFCKGEKLVDGEVKGNPSPQVWQTIMRNMFKEYDWDSTELKSQYTRCAADDIADEIKKPE